MPEPEAYTPIGPITDPAAATAPTNAAPSADALAQGQQQASRMYQLDPNYRPAQEQRQRPQLKQTGFLGSGQVATGQASGGDPLWAATLAAPTFQLDRSLDNIRQQKADIEKWMADATSQFKGRAADPYQKAYQDYVSAEHNKFFQDVADTYYGGDRRKAIEATYRDPELNRQFLNVNRSLGAIGDANKGGYDYYEKVDKAIRDGNAEVDPETQKLLEQGLNGEWAFNGQGPAHNAAQFDRLNDRLSMNKLFDSFYEKNVNNAGDKTEGWSVQKDPKTGRKFLVVDSEKNYDDFVDSFVEQAMKDGPYRDKEEARRFVEARVPSEHALRVNELALGTGGRAATNQRPSVGFAEVGFDASVPGLHQVEGDGVKRRTPVSISMPLKDKDDKPFTESFRFNDNAGTPMRIIPDGFRVNDKGEVFIVGRNAEVTQTSSTNAGKVAVLRAEAQDLTDKVKIKEQYAPPTGVTPEQYKSQIDALKKEREKKIFEAESLEKEETKEKPPVPIPLSGNEAKVKTYFGEQVYNDVMKQAESVKQRAKSYKRKESKPFVEPTKQSAPDYTKVRAKIPTFTKADYDEAMKSEEGRQMLSEMFK